MTSRERILLRILFLVLMAAFLVIYGSIRSDIYRSLVKQRENLELQIEDLARSRSETRAKAEALNNMEASLGAMSEYYYVGNDMTPYDFADMVNETLNRFGIRIEEFAVRESDHSRITYELQGMIDEILNLIRYIDENQKAWIIESIGIGDMNSEGSAKAHMEIGYRIDNEPYN